MLPAEAKLTPRRKNLFPLGTLFTIGLILRFNHIYSIPLWVDEAESCINALSILQSGLPLDHYPGLPLYENTLTIPACWTVGDVADPRTAESAIRRTIDSFGAIDVLINNAGVGLYASATATPVEAARRIFDVNLFASMQFTSGAMPHLRRSLSAAIVNIGSIGGLVSLPWCALYSCSKHALHAYGNSLRREVAGETFT